MAAQQQSNVPAVFNFGTQSIRTIDKDGEVWFVATDVCQILDVENPTQAINRLDDDERSMLNIGRQGEAHIINESGLYSLILSSRKEQAKKFKKWVTGEVLPAIRKTGQYQAQPADRPAKSLEMSVNPLQAMEAANAAASAVQLQVFKELSEGAPGFLHQRYLLAFNYSREGSVPVVQMIDQDACIGSLAKLAKMIAEPGGLMPSNLELVNLARVCNERLTQRLEQQATNLARKNSV